jgi:hypothetical protein
MLTLMFADLVDGHDMRMIQICSGLGLHAEALDVRRRCQLSGENHLQGDNAIKTDLLGHVDHAHAATGDFLQQLVVAEIAEDGASTGVRRCGHADGLRQRGHLLLDRLGDALHGSAIAEERVQVGGQVWVPAEQLGAVGRGAGSDGVQVVGENAFETLIAF